MSFNTISVIGLGYIGLPTAAMFASKQKKVIGVDVSEHVVDSINRGKIHIVEPGLELIVKEAVNEGFLKAVKSPEAADAFLIAVPTPFLPVNIEDAIPEPDLSYIEAAAKSVARVLKKGDLVILESTSPAGTTELMASWLAEARTDLSFPQTHGDASDVRIAYCPERVLPGHVIRELVENDRVIGGMTDKCSQAAIELYSVFVDGECVVTNSQTAEMAKLTENACRDVQIAFANELSLICDTMDVDVWELISLANRHPRINILQPGPGVGGHCIAVDPWFIISKNPVESEIIHTARKINDSKPGWVIEKVKNAISELLKAKPDKTLKDIKIVCFGLTFKPNIDDLRESPALKITQMLSKIFGDNVFAVEPNIDELNDQRISLINLDDAEMADIAVILVNHDEFRGINLKINKRYIIDTVGSWKK